mgnify:CR=1 FL=1
MTKLIPNRQDEIMEPKLHQVFTITGKPTYTFVRPGSYNRLRGALQTPGLGVVVEGPSGIGKTTAVTKAIEETGGEFTLLNARDESDGGVIRRLPEGVSGTVVIDEFHRLDKDQKDALANLMKIEADRDGSNLKIVIVGINDAGRSLIDSSPDLTYRVEFIRFGMEPDERIDELIRKGESALNVDIRSRRSIIENAQGSFYIAQTLCYYACMESEISEKNDSVREVNIPYDKIEEIALEKNHITFGEVVREFARGPKFQRAGMAPYYHILKWITESPTWSLNVAEEMKKHPTEKQSVANVLKNGLVSLCKRESIVKYLHYDKDTRVLSLENPMLGYYLKSIEWKKFARDVGFINVDRDKEFDVALTFAGEDRPFVEKLKECLKRLDYSVFYDFDQQHNILGQDVEDYLSPIYSKKCRYVVVVVGEEYGNKHWTRLEYQKFCDRIGAGEVLVVRSKKVPHSFTDELSGIGSLSYDPDEDLRKEARRVAKVISEKLENS